MDNKRLTKRLKNSVSFEAEWVDIKEPDSDLTIDGGGETCIIAANNCTVNLEAKSLTLSNCLSCIDASNNANVSLRTTDTLQCTASENGITTANNAQVNLNTGENIRIVADRETGAATVLDAADASNINLNASSGSIVIGDEDAIVAIGVRAVNTAQVNVNASDTFAITAVEIGLSAANTATVAVVAADCTVDVEQDQDILTDNEATVVLDCQQDAVLPPEGPVVVEREPIDCQNGIEAISGNADTILEIDGDGETCIKAEGNCRVTIDGFMDIKLTDCERCIRVEGNAQVTLEAAQEIRCEASEDGIRARGTAQLVLRAVEGLTIIAAGGDGIDASGNSDVALTAQTCDITGDRDAIRIRGNATVDTNGCGALNLSGE